MLRTNRAAYCRLQRPVLKLYVQITNSENQHLSKFVVKQEQQVVSTDCGTTTRAETILIIINRFSHF